MRQIYVMTMPEASVDENAGTVFTQHDVGFSWQSRMVESISESPMPQEMPHQHFRFGILAVYGSHVIVALGRGEGVHDNSLKTNLYI